MKHTPIPEQLCSADAKTGWAIDLPPDLDRLFRVSPKLADALEDLVNELGKTPEHVAREYGLQMRNRWLEAREVLAGLEE